MVSNLKSLEDNFIGRLGNEIILDPDLLRAYPALTADDLVNAWSYYQSHTEEINQQIADNESA